MNKNRTPEEVGVDRARAGIFNYISRRLFYIQQQIVALEAERVELRSLNEKLRVPLDFTEEQIRKHVDDFSKDFGGRKFK